MAQAQLSLRWDAAQEGGAYAAQRALELGLEVPAASARSPLLATTLVLPRRRAHSAVEAGRPAPHALQRHHHAGAAVERDTTTTPPPARIEALDALRAVADRYAETAAAERTRRARKHDWAAFEAWCETHALCALPATVDTLRLYLAALAQRGLRASTIRRARCSIGLHHEQRGLPRPDQTCRTRQVERGIARTIGIREVGAKEVLPHELAQLVAGLGESPRADRDRALFLVGFAGGFRTSELVALRVDDLRFEAARVLVLVRSGKEDPLGNGEWTAVPRGARAETCPVRALERWLDRIGRPQSGLLFRRIDGSRVREEAMGANATSRALQRAVARAGLDGKFSAHSLRAGLCSSAYAAGNTIVEIAKHCRMRYPQTVYRYVHLERVPGRPNVAAGLL